jgi:hypothetical protein
MNGDIRVIFLIAVVLMVACVGITLADSGVNATPEVQSLTTGTSANVVGTVTETDTGAWSLTYDPTVGSTIYTPNPASRLPDSVVPGLYPNLLAAQFHLNEILNEIAGFGGTAVYTDPVLSSGLYKFTIIQINIPTSSNAAFLASPIIGGLSWGDMLGPINTDALVSTSMSGGGIHNGALDPGQVQYTTGYNDQYSGVDGVQTFAKSIAVSTGNKIADQSNIKADTSLQFIAIDTGRATRTEDLLLDGASQATSTSAAILCPFATSVSPVIPAYCNIEQAGSSMDTTLTSVVTHADDRFVGTDSTFPVVLNYQINAQGITLSDGTSSPMIGSVSAYLKVHVQEARNASYVQSDLATQLNTLTPLKSEDLVYSETSSASGLITKFGKSMSYQSGFNLI